MQIVVVSPSVVSIPGPAPRPPQCFMNSSLQALAATWPLSQVFLSGAWEKLLNRENKLGTGGRLASAYANLMRGLWRSPPGTRCVRGGPAACLCA